MKRQNGPFINPQIFSTPPPNYNLPSHSDSWKFKSPPPATPVNTTADNSSGSSRNFKSNHLSNQTRNFKTDGPPPTPPFSNASLYPQPYTVSPTVSLAHTPRSFPVASSTSVAEQRTNLLANYLAAYYSKRYDGNTSPSSFPVPSVSYPATPEPFMFQPPQYLPPLPPHPPPLPPQNPPPPKNPPPPPPPSTPPAAPSTSQYRTSHYPSQQYPQQYLKPFYNNFKRKSDSEDYHKKNAKKRKKPLSQNIPQRKDWSVEDAKRALDVEKDCNKRSKRQSLIIKFPDLELNRDIVSKFHPSIDNVHFQQPSTPRFCFVTLKDTADPEAVIAQLNQIPFGHGHLTAEFKKDREEDLNIGPEDIDPLTLYVGNLAQEVTKEDMVKSYPKQKRIDIGYAKKMKYTRYAFVSFKTVDDSIEAFQKTHASQMYSKSLIVRFRRLHGTVGMPGEPKPQTPHRNEGEAINNSGAFSSSHDEAELEQEPHVAPWDIDVSQWEVNSNIVKQERPDSPLSDEEPDIKPPLPVFKTRFMPGSIEVAFALHKPIVVQMKTEQLDNPDEVGSQQPYVPLSQQQNTIDRSPEVPDFNHIENRIKKEQIGVSEKTTTYSILRSLNDKVRSSRSIVTKTEIKAENVGEDPEYSSTTQQKAQLANATGGTSKSSGEDNVQQTAMSSVSGSQNGTRDVVDNQRPRTSDCNSGQAMHKDLVSQRPDGGHSRDDVVIGESLTRRRSCTDRSIDTRSSTGYKLDEDNVSRNHHSGETSQDLNNKAPFRETANPDGQGTTREKDGPRVVQDRNKETTNQKQNGENSQMHQHMEKDTIPVTKANDARDGVVLFPDNRKQNVTNHGKSESQTRDNKGNKDQGPEQIGSYKKMTSVAPVVKNGDSQVPGPKNQETVPMKDNFDSPRIDKVFSLNDEVKSQSNNVNNYQNVSRVNESLERTRAWIEQQFSVTNENVLEAKDKGKDVQFSDWGSETPDIKKEPVEDDDNNDGDEDDSSDDDFDFNNILSGMKGKSKKKKLK